MGMPPFFYSFWIVHYFQFGDIGNKVGLHILISVYGWSYYSFHFSEIRSGFGWLNYTYSIFIYIVSYIYVI